MSLTRSELQRELSYDPLTGIFIRLGTGAEAGGTKASHGYRAISVKGKLQLAHRLAWMYVHGRWPEGVIDHINGDKHDNRLSNLRDVSQSENNANARASKRSRSGNRGVFLHPNGKWRAQVTRKRKATSLGYFEKLEDAVAAYETAASDINARPAGIA